jgi:hypothetical protein
MPSAYETLRQNVEEKITQRNAIRDELNAIPGLIAASLALHVGAPREQVLIGHVEADGISFVEGGVEQFAQRVVFAVSLAFNVGEEADFRLPVKIEAVLHNGSGYTVALEGQQAAVLNRPLSGDANEGSLRAVAEVLGALLLAKIEAHLGQVT